MTTREDSNSSVQPQPQPQQREADGKFLSEQIFFHKFSPNLKAKKKFQFFFLLRVKLVPAASVPSSDYEL